MWILQRVQLSWTRTGILGLRQMASHSSPSTPTLTAVAGAAEVWEMVTPTQRGVPGVRTTSTPFVAWFGTCLCVWNVCRGLCSATGQSSSCDVFQPATTSLIVIINNQACALIRWTCVYLWFVRYSIWNDVSSWIKKNISAKQYMCFSSPNCPTVGTVNP